MVAKDTKKMVMHLALKVIVSNMNGRKRYKKMELHLGLKVIVSSMNGHKRNIKDGVAPGVESDSVKCDR